MDTIAFRDLRHTILTACNNQCHYCAQTAHQIHATTDEQWVPICRFCNFKVRYLTFTSEPDKHAYLAKRTKPAPPDHDMTLLKHHLDRLK